MTAAAAALTEPHIPRKRLVVGVAVPQFAHGIIDKLPQDNLTSGEFIACTGGDHRDGAAELSRSGLRRLRRLMLTGTFAGSEPIGGVSGP